MSEARQQLIDRLTILHDSRPPAIWPNLFRQAAETIHHQGRAIEEARADGERLARRNALLVIEIETLRSELAAYKKEV